jgi:dynamin 1-like protein
LCGQVPEVMRHEEGPNDRENIETEIIKLLTASYFDIVRKNFMDMVPKTIMYFLVNHAKDNLQNELVSSLYRCGAHVAAASVPEGAGLDGLCLSREDMIGELMRETDDVAIRRKNSQEMRILLQRAIDIVNEVRDFNALK